MLLVAIFTVYVHAYAQKKVARKKRIFYKFKALAAGKKKGSPQKGRRTSTSLDALVPTLSNKLAFDLTRICNVNPRTKCCYFLIDGIQLHQESIRIFMDCHHRNERQKKVDSKTHHLHHNGHRHRNTMVNDRSVQTVDSGNKDTVQHRRASSWNMISLHSGNWSDHGSTTLFGLDLNKKSNHQMAMDEEEIMPSLPMPFELTLFWWTTYCGWLCMISYLYFFTVFVAEEISPWSIPIVTAMHQRQIANESPQEIEAVNHFMDGVRFACLVMVFGSMTAVLAQLFVVERVCEPMF